MKKINIRESLLQMDRDTDFKYQLTQLYGASRLTEAKKVELVKMLDGPTSAEDIGKFINAECGDCPTSMSEAFGDDLADDDISNDWTFVNSKSVPDSDGFNTDYTWYRNSDGTHVFVFGDNDIYKPDDGYFDHTCDSESEAREWFDSYTGFESSSCPNCGNDMSGGFCSHCGFDSSVKGDTMWEDLQKCDEAVPAAVMALGTAAATGFGSALGDKVGTKLLGESIELDLEEVKAVVGNAMSDYLHNELGYGNDFINDYVFLEVNSTDDDRVKIEVRAELSYEEMTNLANKLDKVITQYDSNAYFEQEQPGIMTAYLDNEDRGELDYDTVDAISDKLFAATNFEELQKAYVDYVVPNRDNWSIATRDCITEIVDDLLDKFEVKKESLDEGVWDVVKGAAKTAAKGFSGAKRIVGQNIRKGLNKMGAEYHKTKAQAAEVKGDMDKAELHRQKSQEKSDKANKWDEKIKQNKQQLSKDTQGHRDELKKATGSLRTKMNYKKEIGIIRNKAGIDRLIQEIESSGMSPNDEKAAKRAIKNKVIQLKSQGKYPRNKPTPFMNEDLGVDDDANKIATNSRGDYLIAADSGKGFTAYNKSGTCIGGIDGDDENMAKQKFMSGKLDESYVELNESLLKEAVDNTTNREEAIKYLMELSGKSEQEVLYVVNSLFHNDLDEDAIDDITDPEVRQGMQYQALIKKAVNDMMSDTDIDAFEYMSNLADRLGKPVETIRQDVNKYYSSLSEGKVTEEWNEEAHSLELHESDYYFNDETGDIQLVTGEHELISGDLYEVTFVDEDNTKIVYRAKDNTNLEFIEAVEMNEDLEESLNESYLTAGRKYKAKNGAILQIQDMYVELSDYDGSLSATIDYTYEFPDGRNGSSTCHHTDFFKMLTESESLTEDTDPPEEWEVNLTFKGKRASVDFGTQIVKFKSVPPYYSKEMERIAIEKAYDNLIDSGELRPQVSPENTGEIDYVIINMYYKSELISKFKYSPDYDLVTDSSEKRAADESVSYFVHKYVTATAKDIFDYDSLEEPVNEHWTEVYDEFCKIVDETPVDKLETDVQPKVDALYAQHKGEPDWDKAYKRWNEEGSTYESLNEARKPKSWDSMFSKKVLDAFDKGDLTLDNIDEWETEYNGGKKPNPAFDTKAVIDYYKAGNDFRESLNEGLEINQGDLVDFGSYGKLYVCNPNYSDDYYWVTDEEEDRNNPRASGWSIDKELATKVISSLYDEDDDDFDESLTESSDDFSDDDTKTLLKDTSWMDGKKDSKTESLEDDDIGSDDVSEALKALI